MKKTITLSAAVVFALAMAAAAQSATSSTQDQSRNSMQPVTLTGCLAQGSSPNTYVLTNITEVPAAKGTSGQMGMSGQMNEMNEHWKDKRVELMPNATMDLKEHLGHKVEVKGTLEPASKTAPTGTSGTYEKTPMEQLKLTSFRHISTTCPGQ
jgi:hypothetical protein